MGLESRRLTRQRHDARAQPAGRDRAEAAKGATFQFPHAGTGNGVLRRLARASTREGQRNGQACDWDGGREGRRAGWTPFIRESVMPEAPGSLSGLA